jgi:hypothetical protein
VRHAVNYASDKTHNIWGVVAMDILDWLNERSVQPKWKGEDDEWPDAGLSSEVENSRACMGPPVNMS